MASKNNPYKRAEQKSKVAPGSDPASRPTAPAVQGEAEAPVAQNSVVPPLDQQAVEHKKENEQEYIPAVVWQPVEPKIEEKQEIIAPVEEDKPVEPVKENEIIETNAKKLLAGAFEEKPKGRTVGFYLDEEVISALEKLGKDMKIKNKSKLLNTLLRNLLIDKK